MGESGLKLDRAFADERLLCSLTALRQREFAQVVALFERLHRHERERFTLAGKTRCRAPMSGHKGPLTTPRAKVFFVLFYWRFYPSQELMAAVFGLSQGQVSRWLKLLVPLVRESLGRDVPPPLPRPANLARLIILAPGVREILPSGN